MKFSIEVSSEVKAKLKQLWQVPDTCDLIEITAFGDFFVRDGDSYIFYSLTDGSKEDVTDLVLEHGLPPVSFELGDDWYQLEAQSALKEAGVELGEDQCFGFITPIYSEGDYALENMVRFDLLEYHERNARTLDFNANRNG